MAYFNEQDNTMAITTKKIIFGKKNVVCVSHDFEDGMWQFLDDEELDEDNACIVSLAEILRIDGSLNELHDLPLGWIAYREGINDSWKKEKQEN